MDSLVEFFQVFSWGEDLMGEHDSIRYIPVLRWKRAEQGALRQLETSDKAAIKPIIEVLPETTPLGTAVIAEQIARSWGTGKLLVDFDLMRDSEVRAPALSLLAKSASKLGVAVVPVTRLGSSTAFNAAVRKVAKQGQDGVSIRLVSSEVLRPSIRVDIESLLLQLELRPSDVDLVVDFRRVMPADPSFAFFCQRLPEVESWRMFAVLGGSFSRDFTQFRVGQHEYQREEWLRWADEVEQEHERLTRGPPFRG